MMLTPVSGSPSRMAFWIGAEDVAVSHHDPDLGTQSLEGGGEEVSRGAFRLQHGEAMLQAQALYRRRHENRTGSPARLVGLGDHRDHFVAFGNEC
jgi:hypothetical protein